MATLESERPFSDGELRVLRQMLSGEDSLPDTTKRRQNTLSTVLRMKASSSSEVCKRARLLLNSLQSDGFYFADYATRLAELEAASSRPKRFLRDLLMDVVFRPVIHGSLQPVHVPPVTSVPNSMEEWPLLPSGDESTPGPGPATKPSSTLPPSVHPLPPAVAPLPPDVTPLPPAVAPLPPAASPLVLTSVAASVPMEPMSIMPPPAQSLPTDPGLRVACLLVDADILATLAPQHQPFSMDACDAFCQKALCRAGLEGCEVAGKVVFASSKYQISANSLSIDEVACRPSADALIKSGFEAVLTDGAYATERRCADCNQLCTCERCVSSINEPFEFVSHSARLVGELVRRAALWPDIGVQVSFVLVCDWHDLKNRYSDMLDSLLRLPSVENVVGFNPSEM